MWEALDTTLRSCILVFGHRELQGICRQGCDRLYLSLALSRTGVGRLDWGKEISRSRSRWGVGRAWVRAAAVRESGQWIIEKSLVRDNPMAFQPVWLGDGVPLTGRVGRGAGGVGKRKKYVHVIISGPRKPCHVLCGTLRAGKTSSPLEAFYFLPGVASLKLGFSYLWGGGKARPLPGPNQFEPGTGWPALTCQWPWPFVLSLTLCCHLPALYLQTKGGIASVVVPYKAPEVPLGKLTGCFHPFLFDLCWNSAIGPVAVSAWLLGPEPRFKQATFSLPSGWIVGSWGGPWWWYKLSSYF